MRYLRSVTTLEYLPDKCAGCGRCAEVCPHGVFEINGRKAAVTDKDLCMECGACMKNCAFGAIKVDSGVGCAYAMINGMLTGKDPSCGCDTGENGGCC